MDVQEKVLAGVKWLDENHSGWRSKVDWDDLKTSSLKRDVLSFLSESDDKTGYHIVEKQYHHSWMCDHGFDGSSSSYDDLDDEWKKHRTETSLWKDKSYTLRSVNCDRIKSVLSGAITQASSMFSWETSPQGHDYWNNIYHSRSSLTDDDIAFLKHILEKNGETEMSLWRGKTCRLTKHNVKPEQVRNALNGDLKKIDPAIVWSYTPQGHRHWSVVCKGTPLTEDDRAYLEDVLHRLHPDARPEPSVSLWKDKSYEVQIHDGWRKLLSMAEGGDVKGLMDAFDWYTSPQGSSYWSDIHENSRPLTKDDKAFLNHLYSKKLWDGQSVVIGKEPKPAPTTTSWDHVKRSIVMHRDHLKRVIDGDRKGLMKAFDWHCTHKTSQYWSDIYYGRGDSVLLPEDIEFATWLLNEPYEAKKTEAKKYDWEGSSFPKINDVTQLRKVFSDPSALEYAFTWRFTYQGDEHWRQRKRGYVELSESDYAYMNALLTYHGYGTEKPVESLWKGKELDVCVSDVLKLKESLTNHKAVMVAFDWASTPQGYNHWDKYYYGSRSLTQDDKNFLNKLIDDNREKIEKLEREERERERARLEEEKKQKRIKEYAVKVKAGMAYLDQEVPNWRDKIDTWSLNMGRHDSHILKQVWRPQEEYPYDTLRDIQGPKWMEDHGFATSSFHNDDELTQVWKDNYHRS